MMTAAAALVLNDTLRRKNGTAGQRGGRAFQIARAAAGRNAGRNAGQVVPGETISAGDPLPGGSSV
jgi:hypothetical protein